MAKYKIREGLAMTVIPGVGAVKPGDVLDGDYDRFVPGKLQKVGESASAPTPKPEPKPKPAIATDEAEEPEEELEAEAPNMDWLKDDLVDYAEMRGLDTSGTKAEILKRIEESAS